MVNKLPYSFPGQIFRSPMPFSQFDHSETWEAYQQNAVQMVVILTEKAEYLVYAGRDLPSFYESHGLEILHIPVPDFGIPPDLNAWEDGIAKVTQAAEEGKNVAIHCLAGIGRTGTFLACLAKKDLGLDGKQAIRWVREYLPGAMENQHQERFVTDF